MYTNRSPPNQQHPAMGGSTNGTIRSSTTSPTTTPTTVWTSTAASNAELAAGSCSGSTLSLYSNSSAGALLKGAEKRCPHHHQHTHRHAHYSHNSGSTRSGSSQSSSSRRGKKHNWGTRGRTGMSFLIVIAFFAIFGLIILTQLFMIDERSHSGVGSTRTAADSMPDYDNVKDDYDLLNGNLLGDNKLGFVQLQDNKLKIHDADANDAAGRWAGILINSGINTFGGMMGGGGVGAGSSNKVGLGSINVNAGGNGRQLIPWGKVLPTYIEETLPSYPVGMLPTDGAWQVVNGTRFKFFVFSAFYDRRDGVKMVRVVGATKTRDPERVWCRFWYTSRNSSQTSTVTGTGAGTSAQRGKYLSATVMARVKIIRENWNLKYSACFILCPIRTSDLDVPQYVSIVSRLRTPPGNLLLLRNTDWDDDFNTRRQLNGSSHKSAQILRKGYNAATASSSPLPTGDQIPEKIAVCVKPFHFNYDQALYLMEYLEFYALLGVSHFTFYNHTLGKHAGCVLQHYMDGDVPGNLTAWDEEMLTPMLSPFTHPLEVPFGSNDHNDNSDNSSKSPPKKHYESLNYLRPTVTMLPWDLRMRSQKEIRTEGLFAAFNDCLYRTMYRYKYLALVDLDEFIVPRHNDTLNDLIYSLNRRFRNHNTGAYSFQNAFFYLQFPDDPLVYQNKGTDEQMRLRAALVTQRKTRRRYKLHPQKQRSKYICKPEAVIEAGNHFVWEFSPGKGSLNVPPTEAILQHYRTCEFGGNDCIKAPSVVDRTATKYVNRLLQRVEMVYKYLKGRCDLPELPKLQRPQQDKNKDTNINESQRTKVVKTRTSTSKTNANNESSRRTSSRIKADSKTTLTNTLLKPESSRKTTTTVTMSSPTKANNTTMLQAKTPNSVAKTGTKVRKKRKIVVFEEGLDGLPQARVEYEE